MGDHYNNIWFIKPHEGYKKRKAQKKKNKRALTHCLASLKMVGLVCSGGRKKRSKIIVGVNVDLFCV